MMLRGATLLAVLLLGAGSGASRAEEAVPGTDRTLKGDAVCTHCHDETEAKPVLSIYKTPHGVKADERTPGCQSCHGPSVGHVKNPDGASTRPLVDINFGVRGAAAARLQAEPCLSCHTGGQREHWAGSEHERRDVPCTSCHVIHAAQDRVMNRVTQQEACFTCHKTQRAQIHRISAHPLAVGEMGCSDCHNPHGSIGPVLMAKNSINETCYTCHAERRGPFLWSHQPVQEDCTTCHTPHGMAGITGLDRKSTRLNSSHSPISYAVF